LVVDNREIESVGNDVNFGIDVCLVVRKGEDVWVGNRVSRSMEPE
jgi:hypothetical protein